MPKAAVVAGVTGTVVAKVRVQHGRATVTELTGPEIFHAAVTDAVSKYKCTDSNDVVIATQSFVFKIEESGPRPPVSEKEMRNEYERIVARDFSGTEYAVRHILVAKHEDAMAVLQRIKAGEPFAKVAADASTDMASRPRGGDLGWAVADSFVKPFAQAVVSLAPNGLSAEPVQTNFGWHVVEVLGARAQTPPLYEQMKSEIARKLQSEQVVVDPNEVRAAYDRFVALNAGLEYEVRHILVETRAQAEAALARIKAGESFGDVAKDVSRDPGSRVKGGEMGWNNPKNFIEPFSATMVSLAPKGLAASPTQTSFGWHVIEVTGVRTFQPPPFSVVKGRIERCLQRKKLDPTKPC